MFVSLRFLVKWFYAIKIGKQWWLEASMFEFQFHG